jgi:hypothetical protein
MPTSSLKRAPLMTKNQMTRELTLDNWVTS